jgi:hypothetical protein
MNQDDEFLSINNPELFWQEEIEEWENNFFDFEYEEWLDCQPDSYFEVLEEIPF